MQQTPVDPLKITTHETHFLHTVEFFERDPCLIAAGLSAIDLSIIHGALGLSTEIWEYKQAKTIKNRREELGDAFWYLNLIYYRAVETYNGLLPTGLLDRVYYDLRKQQDSPNYSEWLRDQTLMGTAMTIQDAVKSLTMYMSGTDCSNPESENYLKMVEKVKVLLTNCIVLRDLLEIECAVQNFDLEHILRINHAKLAKRYRDKAFTSDAALNRDLAAEEEVLAAHCSTAEG